MAGYGAGGGVVLPHTSPLASFGAAPQVWVLWGSLPHRPPGYGSHGNGNVHGSQRIPAPGGCYGVLWGSHRSMVSVRLCRLYVSVGCYGSLWSLGSAGLYGFCGVLWVSMGAVELCGVLWVTMGFMGVY